MDQADTAILTIPNSDYFLLPILLFYIFYIFNKYIPWPEGSYRIHLTWVWEYDIESVQGYHVIYTFQCKG